MLTRAPRHPRSWDRGVLPSARKRTSFARRNQNKEEEAVRQQRVFSGGGGGEDNTLSRFIPSTTTMSKVQKKKRGGGHRRRRRHRHRVGGGGGGEGEEDSDESDFTDDDSSSDVDVDDDDDDSDKEEVEVDGTYTFVVGDHWSPLEGHPKQQIAAQMEAAGVTMRSSADDPWAFSDNHNTPSSTRETSEILHGIHADTGTRDGLHHMHRLPHSSFSSLSSGLSTDETNFGKGQRTVLRDGDTVATIVHRTADDIEQQIDRASRDASTRRKMADMLVYSQDVHRGASLSSHHATSSSSSSRQHQQQQYEHERTVARNRDGTLQRTTDHPTSVHALQSASSGARLAYEEDEMTEALARQLVRPFMRMARASGAECAPGDVQCFVEHLAGTPCEELWAAIPPEDRLVEGAYMQQQMDVAQMRQVLASLRRFYASQAPCLDGKCAAVVGPRDADAHIQPGTNHLYRSGTTTDTTVFDDDDDSDDDSEQDIIKKKKWDGKPITVRSTRGGGGGRSGHSGRHHHRGSRRHTSSSSSKHGGGGTSSSLSSSFFSSVRRHFDANPEQWFVCMAVLVVVVLVFAMQQRQKAKARFVAAVDGERGFSGIKR